MLAFALSLGVLLVWRLYFFKPVPPPPKTAQPAPTLPAARPALDRKAPVPAQLPITEGRQPQQIVIDGGDLYQVTLDTQGAVVKSWILKKYRDEKEDLLDVVNRPACEQLGFPMSLDLVDPNLSRKLNTAVYVATPRQTQVKAPATVEFVYSDGEIQARKKLSFGADYQIHVEVSVFDGQHYLPVEVAWPGGFGDQSLPPRLRDSVNRAVYGTPEDVTTVSQSKVSGDRLIPGPLPLAGLEDRYFVAIFLPDFPELAFRFGRRAWAPPDWKEKEQPRPLTAMLGGPLAQPLGFRLFVAPKDLDVLRGEKPPLDRLVDFGWFSVVAKPLFIGMRYIYDHWVHNYGWAIVILTILINLLLFPLKLKSIRSAQEMQKVAPVIKAIQERYKQYKFNDPRKQRMNQEVMKVYQEHGINPLGGCLPQLVLLPFLYGFYRVLDLSIELRHAPWILWIRDLSAPDTFHLFGLPLPILPP